MRNHALHPQPDVALALFLRVPPDDMVRRSRRSGFSTASTRSRWRSKSVIWGAPRPRNEKPGAVSRAGLGHTPEGYIFIHGSRFNVQKSQVEVASCTEVTSCTTHRLYSASQEVFVGHPIVGVRPMKNPARFPGRAWTHFSSVLFCTFLVFSTKGAAPLPDLNTALLLRKRISLLRRKILPLAPKVTPFQEVQKAYPYSPGWRHGETGVYRVHADSFPSTAMMTSLAALRRSAMSGWYSGES